MSFSVKDGKDIIIFAEKEYVDLQTTPVPENEVEEQKNKPEEGVSAFNPETGEINWDCPCLGGMATGPCGEEFKAAFSCFVYSEAEPKGVDCVEHFKNMQDCFRRHPDVYGDEIDNEEEEEEEEEEKKEQTQTETQTQTQTQTQEEEEKQQLEEEVEIATIVASSVIEENETQSLSSWVSSWF
ncbi:hypothetical protein BDF14DRAFT_1841003 [Spinellus fusiger]|nr:hypothetical protein BDF14DRAFT_1841003 [Spinellus fusiger]